MFFNQKSHPLHFETPQKLLIEGKTAHLKGKTFLTQVECQEVTSFCTRLSLVRKDRDLGSNLSDGIRTRYRKGRKISGVSSSQSIHFKSKSAEIELSASRLQVSLPGIHLSTIPHGIGFNGIQSILRFQTSKVSGFYGFGERTKRFNKSGDSLDFWTVDVVGVFPHAYERDDYDPSYVSIPLAIIKQNGSYAGLYFDNSNRLIMDIGKTTPGEMFFQSLNGNNDIYLIAGPTLRDVVRNFTELTGRGEMPPVWSMGYHQCRWGYQTEEEFRALQKNFEKHNVPVSALWCDIDYMNEYRVFTWDKVDFPNPRRLTNDLKKKNIHLVTIVDPGVKLEKGYSVYESGKKKDVFCKAASGLDYVGSVWPGDTVFPDFTIEKAREWWAEWCKKFMKEDGVDGLWLDMNDPSTGWSRCEDMLFKNGKVDHEPYHNQVGHFMAKASREAFEKLNPQQRPFLLTRSAYTGSQRYTAVWNGDNCSNWKHLRMSIPCTMNLGLSGIAFNGPDVGGFMGDTNADLLTRWFQAGFLFPFFRNHSLINSKTQEPWEFGTECLTNVRNIIQMRYRLLPYIYQCFFEHYLTGDPILRPMLYEFEDPAYENIDDQYLVGANLLVAPILHPLGETPEVFIHGKRHQTRQVHLPVGWWFDLNQGEWIDGGKTITVQAHMGQVPIFVRDGSIIPFFNGKLQNAEVDLHDIEFHFFLKNESATLDYHIDNPENRRYLEGKYKTMKISAQRVGGTIEICAADPSRKLQWTPVIYGKGIHQIEIDSFKKRFKTSERLWVGESIPVLVLK